ncbi:MAG: NAD-binding protein [Chloroherpetonaceae bacterium]|nr:NAD-binding protein [Chthonomonadaceae bacterium]MDW8207951.1 NAD-binding protein [Chloroherpetonaceae bacterium]
MENPSDVLDGHVILCGMGHVGYRIAEILHMLRIPFAVVTREIRPEWSDWVHQHAARLIFGDARSETHLRAAGIATARALCIVTDNDLVNTEIALDVQRCRPDIAMIVRIFDLYLAERISLFANIRNVISPAMLTAPVFVAAALGNECLRVFEIDGCTVHVLRLTVRADQILPGETARQFCARHNLLLLAHLRTQHNARQPESATRSPDCPLHPDEELIVAGAGAAVERLMRRHRTSRRRRRRRAGTRAVRFPHAVRALLTVRDMWRQAPPVLQQAFLSLLTFILVSSAVIRFALPGNLSWIDAFYFVITVITTVGFGDYHFRDAPAWLKLYGTGMMVSGALLVAVLYGIVTDYIVSLRVEQTLGRRSSHETDHVVVIGLGDVGSRVAEMLHRMRVPVVAIERAPEQEALPALQDLIHVIVADANRESALLQANVPMARAVVITTSSDLDSLRLAHLAGSLNPDARLIVRLYDSRLAQKLGAAIGLDAIVNAAATAAPTFVACALQTGVEQGFLLEERLLLLRWLSRDEVEARGLVGRTVQEIRSEGYMAVLKNYRAGEHRLTEPVTPEDVIERGEALLVLEEYDAERDVCHSPSTVALCREDTSTAMT